MTSEGIVSTNLSMFSSQDDCCLILYVAVLIVIYLIDFLPQIYDKSFKPPSFSLNLTQNREQEELDCYHLPHLLIPFIWAETAKAARWEKGDFAKVRAMVNLVEVDS